MNSEPKTGNPTNCVMNRKIEATFERLVKDRNCRAVEFASKSFKPLLIKIGPSGSNGLDLNCPLKLRTVQASTST